MAFFGLDSKEKKKPGGLDAFGQGIGLKYNGFGEVDALSTIFSKYSMINMWTSENLLIDGTSTTALDYAEEHDLVNPAASNQPAFTAEDSDFNDKPSLNFDGTSDHLTKLISNYRSADGSGVITIVANTSTINRLYGFTAGDTAANANFFEPQISGGRSRFNQKTDPGANNVFSVATFTWTDTHVVSFISKGSSYGICIDGVTQSLTFTEGDTGEWFDESTALDNISIGALLISSSIFAQLDWAMSGYNAYTTDEDVSNLQTDLMAHYGI